MRLGKQQFRILQDMQGAGLVIRRIQDYRRNAKPYCVLEDEDNVNTYENLTDAFVQRLFDRKYITMHTESKSLDIEITTFRASPDLPKLTVACLHDFGDANYGFQMCIKCGYTY